MSLTTIPSGSVPNKADPRVLERDNTFLTKIHVCDQHYTAKDVKQKIASMLGKPKKTADGSTPHISALIDGCTRVGKSPKSYYAFFSFGSEEEKAKGIEILTQVCHRGTPWKNCEVTEDDRQNLCRRGPENNNNNEFGKRERDDNNNKSDSKKEPDDNVAPWQDVPYEEQIERKKKHCIEVLEKIAFNVRQACQRERVAYPAWLQKLPRFTPCVELKTVHHSPSTSGYRNRTDLTIGLDVNNKPTAGFNVGAVRNGHFAVKPIDGIATVSPVAQQMCDAFTKWMLQFPELEVYDKPTHTGFWRRISLRHTIDGETMISIQTRSDYGTDGEDIDVKRQALWNSAKQVLGPHVTSLQWQEWDGASNAAPFSHPYTVLSGPATIAERVWGTLNFAISPNSFFQVNTAAAELLLRKVADEACLDEDTILLDLCCGTGFIGLCLAREVDWVFGVEMVESAIEDAKKNAAVQGTENVTYICSKLEETTKTLQNMIRERQEKAGRSLKLVAIVDPARGGLHTRVGKWLRSVAELKHLVYISCDQGALMNDCIGLMKPETKEYRNAPFVPVLSFGLDLFPHTPHVEQVLVLHRADDLDTVEKKEVEVDKTEEVTN